VPTRCRVACAWAWTLVLACTTVEPRGPAYQQTVEGFKVGVTTRSDAERLLGLPQYEAKEGDLVRLAWSTGPQAPAGSGSPASAAAARLLVLHFGPEGRLARPPTTVFPGSAQTPLDEPGMRPAGAPTPCRSDADCAADEACRQGRCRG
jgi:hypothetical protein